MPKKIIEKPGRFFSWAEVTKSATGQRLGIDNSSIPFAAQARLIALCASCLDPIRDYFGPVSLNSGYRSPALNKAVGGALKSQHMVGEAADFIVIGNNQEQVTSFVVNNLVFDQLILYHKNSGGFMHISYCIDRKNREQVLVQDSNKRLIVLDTAALKKKKPEVVPLELIEVTKELYDFVYPPVLEEEKKKKKGWWASLFEKFLKKINIKF